MRSLLHRSGHLGLALGAWLLACRTPGDPAEGSTDTEAALDPAEPPIFIDPASSMLRVTTERTDDIVLSVERVVPGSTRFVLDGRSHGDLSTTPWIGSLEARQLVLRTRGAMVSARHVLWLETPSVDGPARSGEIVVDVVVDALPTLVAEIEDAPRLRARSILSEGIETEGTLLVYDDADEAGPSLLALRASAVDDSAAIAWDLEDPVVVPVGPLVEIGGALPASALVLVGDADDPADDRIRVVWRADQRTIVLVDRPWHGEAAPPIVALNLDQLDTTSFEHASLGRPVLFGDTLVVETNLLTDTEAPRPGDRRITSVQLSGDPVEAGPPRVSALVGTADVDHIGSALDYAAWPSGPRPLAVRVHGGRADVFEVDPGSGLLRRRSTRSTLAGWQGVSAPVGAVLGAFGSRTMVGVAGDDLLVQTFDDSGNQDASEARIPVGVDATVAGRPALAVVGGHPVILVPRGAEQPVLGIVVSGGRVSTTGLEEVHCDEIAMPATLVALRSTTSTFACRLADDVRFGVLGLGS
jgi:hypothetical protein